MQLTKLNQLFIISALCSVFIACGSSSDKDYEPTEGYNSNYCKTVANSLNIHWEYLEDGVPADERCTGIEITDGTKDSVVDGKVNLEGQSIELITGDCLGVGNYNFTISKDKLTLEGAETLSDPEIEMTLSRNPEEDCFVGLWIGEGDNLTYRAHISADFFLED